MEKNEEKWRNIRKKGKRRLEQGDTLSHRYGEFHGDVGNKPTSFSYSPYVALSRGSVWCSWKDWRLIEDVARSIRACLAKSCVVVIITYENWYHDNKCGSPMTISYMWFYHLICCQGGLRGGKVHSFVHYVICYPRHPWFSPMKEPLLCITSVATRIQAKEERRKERVGVS